MATEDGRGGGTALGSQSRGAFGGGKSARARQQFLRATAGDQGMRVSVQLSLRGRRGFPEVGLSELSLGKPRANRLAVPR